MATARELDIASSERVALRQEKGCLEEDLEAMSQNLKSAQEKLNFLEVSIASNKYETGKASICCTSCLYPEL